MTKPEGGVAVGVLGQWASGKTEAARTLIRHLGGEDRVVFLTDRVLFASQVVQHILDLEASEMQLSVDDGGQRLDSKLATIWLGPTENLRRVDPGSLRFDVHDDEVMLAWRRRAKTELGPRIREMMAGGRPVVVEATYAMRSLRNATRPAKIPVGYFERSGADGGDLDPEQQQRWEEKGTIIRRVANDHDDLGNFRADVIAAFEAMFAGDCATVFGRVGV